MLGHKLRYPKAVPLIVPSYECGDGTLFLSGATKAIGPSYVMSPTVLTRDWHCIIIVVT